MSVAISQVYGSALQGKCKQRPELVDTAMPLCATLSVLPCRGGETFLRRLFEPLDYRVIATRDALDPVFPEWGKSPYFTVQLDKETSVRELLTHLYVLIPVMDNFKHYFVGEAEVRNLLAKGEGWLARHPEREQITKRYLKYDKSLARLALARLAEEEALEALQAEAGRDSEEVEMERAISLNEHRVQAVLDALKETGAKRVLDLGCGEGQVLRRLLKDKQFTEIVGMDVSIRSLEIAGKRLHLDELPPFQKERIRLMHGSLMYRDERLAGFDAAVVVEVVEHLDPPRLVAFERVLSEHARPGRIILTSPNREYNATWESIGPDRFRHRDHRFEWTREEFQAWASGIAERFGYGLEMHPVGPVDDRLGPPTQMAVFQREAGGEER